MCGGLVRKGPSSVLRAALRATLGGLRFAAKAVGKGSGLRFSPLFRSDGSWEWVVKGSWADWRLWAWPRAFRALLLRPQAGEDSLR